MSPSAAAPGFSTPAPARISAGGPTVARSLPGAPAVGPFGEAERNGGQTSLRRDRGGSYGGARSGNIGLGEFPPAP